MPRPAYIAAHSPAGPAPTMITSYGCLTLSLIGPQFSIRNPQLQSRRLGIAGEPVFAGVEEVTGALERRLADLGSHPAAACAAPIRNRFRAPWHELIVPTNTAAAAPLSPAARTIASPSRTASTAKVPTPNT